MQSSKQARQSADANQLLSELAVHALLHLHFKIHASSRPLPTTERNDLLQKWLKPKLKSNRYKLIKKPLKSLTQQAKGENGNLEALLERCVDANKPSNPQPHLDSYLLLINEIEKNSVPRYCFLVLKMSTYRMTSMAVCCVCYQIT